MGQIIKNATSAEPDPAQPVTAPAPHNRWLPVKAAVLFVLFFSLYVRIGTSFPDKALLIQDLFFDADVARVVGDMTSGSTASYYRTNVHPLFLLLFNPVGSLLVRAGVREPHAAVYLDAFLGGLAVVLSLLFFTITTTGHWYPILFSCLLGFSFSHLFWSSIPEAYVAGSCSIIFCFLLLAWRISSASRRGKLVWGLAGIVTLGITTTNFVHAIVTSLFSMTGPMKPRIVQAAKIMSVVFLIVVAGSIVQSMIYPESLLFFAPSSIVREKEFIFSDLVTAPQMRIRTLFEGTLVFNVVAPMPFVYYESEAAPGQPAEPAPNPPAEPAPDQPADETASTPAEPVPAPDPPFPILYFIYITMADFAGSGRVAAVAWLLLLVVGLVYCFKDRRNPMILALLASIGFQWALHSVYGYEPFLYSPHVTFQVLALVALGIGRKYDALWIALVACVLVLTAVNNLNVIAAVLQAYTSVKGL